MCWRHFSSRGMFPGPRCDWYDRRISGPVILGGLSLAMAASRRAAKAPGSSPLLLQRPRRSGARTAIAAATVTERCESVACSQARATTMASASSRYAAMTGTATTTPSRDPIDHDSRWFAAQCTSGTPRDALAKNRRTQMSRYTSLCARTWPGSSSSFAVGGGVVAYVSSARRYASGAYASRPRCATRYRIASRAIATVAVFCPRRSEAW
mmetsp:Transcript_22593/g.89709  ORF Transcript_22593/g.89709 Transcript_22593/m.89709 type:complete len:210 (-) Transcript_22593:423-1052(-)